MASTQPPPPSKIERAHQMYREGRHQQALGFYTEALVMAKSNAQKIALHSNRAACYLKLHNFKQAAEECTSVLELDQKHTGALMLRAQTLVTLKEYHSALFDVNRLLELNPSSEMYQNLQIRLKTQLSLAPIPECEVELEEDEEDDMVEPKSEEEETVYGQEVEETVYEKKEVATGAAERDEKDSAFLKQNIKESSSQEQSKGWQAIPKPKGHSNLDYSRWDRVEDGSSEEEDDDDDDSKPQYRFRVRTVGVRPVK